MAQGHVLQPLEPACFCEATWGWRAVSTLQLNQPHPTQDVYTLAGCEAMAARVGIRELRARLASHLESVTPIEVTRHGRTIGLYVPLPQTTELDERQRLLQAGRLMQAELERLGLTEEEISADFKAWRQRRHQP